MSRATNHKFGTVVLAQCPPCPLVPFRDTCDIDIGGFSVRVYTPEGELAGNGWPVFVWFHGGGWAIRGV